MAVIALTNGIVYVAGHNVSCDINQMSLEVDVNELDVTTMCSDGWTEVIGGLKSARLNVAGFWQAGTDQIDAEAFDNLGTADRVVTIGHSSTEGSTAYLLQANQIKYSLLGPHGEAAPFTLEAAGSNAQGAIQGSLLAAKQDVTSTGAFGTGVQVGAVAADEYLYAVLHCFSAGTTFTAVIESDDNGSFSSATTRATFSGVTSAGGTWATRVAGAITDDYWRIRATTVTGTFNVAAAIGIA